MREVVDEAGLLACQPWLRQLSGGPRLTVVRIGAGHVERATPSQRDQRIQVIQAKGRLGWQEAVGYGRRPHAQTAVSRCKATTGPSLRARTLPAQRTEAKVACSVLNRMARLGTPVS